jgi:excisionase family DNA binding protein
VLHSILLADDDKEELMATVALQLDLAELNEPEAVAAALKVSKGTVYRFIKSGDLFAYKVGSQYRIPGWAVLQYLGIETGETGQLPEQAAPTELHPNLTPASSPAPPEPVVLAERADKGVVHAA